MKIQIVTSCTGRKRVHSRKQLLFDDFLKSDDHIHKRESSLKHCCLPAGEMYTGQQHVRLMAGLEAIRSMKSSNIVVELYIFSAGYGLIHENRRIAPYDCTFNHLSSAQSGELMRRTKCADRFEEVLRQENDFTLILLGNAYLKLLNLSSPLQVSSPTLFFAGEKVSAQLRLSDSVQTLSLTNQDAQRFSCGMVGLKGEVAARILRSIAIDTRIVNSLMTNPSKTLDEIAEN